jgi:hypothetical protein
MAVAVSLHWVELSRFLSAHLLLNRRENASRKGATAQSLGRFSPLALVSAGDL